ncbi:Zn-dependent exopeptidase, partial [Zopfia rhizophila CBS 207.26]
MKLTSFALALSASSAVALTIPRDAPTPTTEQLYTVELAPGETKQVTEEQKWELLREGKHFMDITDYASLGDTPSKRQAVTFPSSVSNQASVTPIITKLNKSNMQTNLQTFSNFNNRYYRASTGKQSSDWLLSRVQDVIKASGASGASAKAFTHSWSQSSIIATIPGKSNKTIVVGAHQDSINLDNPSSGRAPGADDDGSGSVTILEAMRVLLGDSNIAGGQAPNTIEFHWYAAEEAGLLGSQAIFNNYKSAGRVVKAMLNQDMTGYIKGTIDAGQKESLGVITDYVDTPLTEFIKKVVTAYCAIPFVSTKCGYACSDHASASRAGYPSAFVIEAAMEYTSELIHTAQDTISTVSFDHMIEHAKMTVGFAYELAFAANL